jgi:hypothetical protein
LSDDIDDELIKGTSEAPDDLDQADNRVQDEVSESRDDIDDTAELVDTITIDPDKLGDEERLEVDEHQQAIINIQNSNAEAGEDGNREDQGEVPMQDYDAMSMEQLVVELESLITNQNITAIRDHIEEIKKSFLNKYHHFIDEKRQEFHTVNPDSTEDFHYHLPAKARFDQLYGLYRDRKNSHYKRQPRLEQLSLPRRELL